MDGLVAGLNAIEMTEETRIRSQKLCAIINEEVELLIDWIQTPIYSPDHPIGNNMMKKTSMGINFSYTTVYEN